MSYSNFAAAIKRSDFQRKLLVAGVLLIALNLRPSLAAVGPLVSFIREGTNLSNSMLGLLTTLPLLAFGIVSTLTPLFTRNFGIERTLFGAMILLSTGILLRVFKSVEWLFLGTLLLGIAIALGNVLLPTIVKRDFPHRSGLITSLYSSMMGIGAAFAAGISVPLAQQGGLGWRWSMASWALLSIVAMLIWLPQLKHRTSGKSNRSFLKAMKGLGGSRLAWQVAIFMGLQSFAFYVILAWLPEILQSRGLAASQAGWMLSLSQCMGVLGTLLIPLWADKKKDQRKIVAILVLMEAISLAGLMLPGTFLVSVWVSLIGFALGGSFGMALLFIVLRSGDAEKATELSGMSQSIGYLLAAGGPMLFGFIYDVTQNWLYSFLLLAGILLVKLWVGLGAGRPRQC